MRKNKTLTDRAIRALKPGEWATDTSARGAPTLQVRKLADGSVSSYLRYTKSDRKQDRIPLGIGLTLAEARREVDTTWRRAESLRPKYPDLSLRNDLKGMLLAETEAQAALARKEAEAKAEQSEATFDRLLSAYIEDLKRRNTIRWREVETSFERNIR